jgi:hypothetical protein
LDRVYNELETSEQPFTIEQFAKQSGVRFEVASGYVDLRRGPQPTRDEQLEKAYTRRQATGEKITVHTLSKETHISTGIVAPWLTKRRLAEGMRPVRNGGAVHWVSA